MIDLNQSVKTWTEKNQNEETKSKLNKFGLGFGLSIINQTKLNYVYLHFLIINM